MSAPEHPGRRRTARVAGCVFLVAVMTMAAVSSAPAGSDVLLGPFDGSALSTTAMFAALTALTVGIWSLDVPRWLLPLSIIGGLAGAGASVLAGAWLALTVPSTTVLVSDGCETGYVAVERSFLLLESSTIYRQDGLLITEVAHASGDDGHQPFSSGTYDIAESDGSWLVRYSIEPAPGRDGEPFTLPILTDRSPECSAADPIGLPSVPPITAAVSFTMPDVDAAMRERVQATFRASIGGFVTEYGGVDVPDATTMSCEGGGLRQELDIAFRTDDNAGSLSAILSDWDAAGYLADRAMQQDLRYSETLPVKLMSIRDRTSIDGMLHLRVESVCAPAE